MVESISELRKICQDTRETVYFKMPWFPKHVTRRISIYFTKLCLKIGISANQASIISLVFLIAGGVFFIFADPRLWFIGILLSYGYRVFDCVDGEIARYNKSSSLGGKQLDGSIGLFAMPYMLACMTFGIYNSLHSITAFIFGFLAVIASATSAASSLHLLVLAHREGLFPDRKDMPGKEPMILRYGRIVYRVLIAATGVELLPQLLVVATIDCFVSPFTILSLSFNARLIYLALVGLATSAGAVVIAFHDVISYKKVKT
jgi:phosphatidylglycerophosphate synthase